MANEIVKGVGWGMGSESMVAHFGNEIRNLEAGWWLKPNPTGSVHPEAHLICKRISDFIENRLCVCTPGDQSIQPHNPSASVAGLITGQKREEALAYTLAMHYIARWDVKDEMYTKVLNTIPRNWYGENNMY